jgi:hypothetical protein
MDINYVNYCIYSKILKISIIKTGAFITAHLQKSIVVQNYTLLYLNTAYFRQI